MRLLIGGTELPALILAATARYGTMSHKFVPALFLQTGTESGAFHVQTDNSGLILGSLVNAQLAPTGTDLCV